ncbi:hypothetical protein H6F89_09515 [Cyanobacteria bacterium FACHB-63]|nr:hypothetical protein [Cyanobacteria bacterium FACHB-63]
MSINYQILLLLSAGILGSFLLFDRWSRGRSNDLPGKKTLITDDSARCNNELLVNEPKGETTVELIETEARSQKQLDSDQGATSISDVPSFPLVAPDQASPEVQACLSEIQDTLEIPWTPANWRSYAEYPSVMQLFWKRLKPVTQTEYFLESAIAITEQVYRDINDWYQPSYQIEVNASDRRHIQRELNAFSFGNPQLLIQQIALSRTLSGEVVGEDGKADHRRGAHPYRHPEIKLITEQSASAEIQQVYRDIQQTLGVSIVNSDYQALAQWSTFFTAAWKDIKLWRDRPEYQLLRESVVQAAENAASRLRPAVFVGEEEIRDLLDDPEAIDQIRQSVQMFTEILPDLIIQDALFHLGLASMQPVSLPTDS